MKVYKNYEDCVRDNDMADAIFKNKKTGKFVARLKPAGKCGRYGLGINWSKCK